MQNLSDLVASVIAADPVLLDQVHRGLFVVARRGLGFNPAGTSAPFGTSRQNRDGNTSKVEIDRAEGPLYIDLCFMPFLQQVADRLKAAGASDHVLGELCSPIERYCVTMALIESDLDPMFGYAEKFAEYSPQWRDLA